MRKPVLGRGLGRLMQTPSASQPKEETAPLAPGLRILIRGTEAVPPPTVTTDAAAPAQPAERSISATAEETPISRPESATVPALQPDLPDLRVAWIPVAGVALLLADVALVIWAIIWLKAQPNPGALAMAGCVVSIFTGCLFGGLSARLLFK